jgi:hypothetical protein
MVNGLPRKPLTRPLRKDLRRPLRTPAPVARRSL